MRGAHRELPFHSPRYATRAGAALMLVGGALLWITVILPPAALHSDAAVVAAGGLVMAIGLVLLWAEEVPAWVRFACASVGTIVITIAAYETGLGSRGGENNTVLYIWPALYCSLFLPWRMALVELVLINGSYGVLVFSADPPAEAFTRCLVTSITMFVVVLLVARLRATLDVSLGTLTNLADRDPLTGALNRRALSELAAAELTRSRVTGDPISVIAADIDNLKVLNDRAGHAAGDLALRSAARLLSANTREGDTVARVGGDEFVVLLPGASTEEARAVAGRLRSDPLDGQEFADVPVRLSIGVATGAANLTFDEIWRAADDALYRFKRGSGRELDCVVLGSGLRVSAAPAAA